MSFLQERQNSININLQAGEFGQKFGDFLNFERFNTLINSKDTGIYEMSLQGARDINEQLKCYDDIYYYSYSTCCTTKIEGTNIYYPNEHCVVTRPLTLLMGTYTGKAIGGEIDIDESWLPNDGNVNTISQLYPFDEKHKDFDKNNICKQDCMPKKTV